MSHGLPVTTYLSVTELETRGRLFEAERHLLDARSSARPTAERPRRRRLLAAVRGAAAA